MSKKRFWKMYAKMVVGFMLLVSLISTDAFLIYLILIIAYSGPLYWFIEWILK